MLYGIPRDPDLAVALTQLEEEENENMDDEKPKVRELRHILWYLLAFFFCFFLLSLRHKTKNQIFVEEEN